MTGRACFALGMVSLGLSAGCGDQFLSFHSNPDGGIDSGATGGGGENATGGKRGTGGKRATGGSSGSSGAGGAETGGGGGDGGAGGLPGDSGGGEAASGEAGVNECEPAPPLVPGTVVAHCTIGEPPVIDGSLEDWPADYFTNDVNRATAEPYGVWSTDDIANDSNLSATFAVRWDVDAIYVAAKIRDDFRSAPDAAHFYQNDAFEVFLDGNGDGGNYGADDIQLLFDVTGRSQANHYPTLDPFPVPAGVTSAVQSAVVGASWTIEVRAPWSILGSNPHPMGKIIGFDTALDDNDVGTRERALVWRNASPNACACAAAPNPEPCEPYCYAGTFFKVQLGGR